jgi:hypothetical protein
MKRRFLSPAEAAVHRMLAAAGSLTEPGEVRAAVDDARRLLAPNELRTWLHEAAKVLAEREVALAVAADLAMEAAAGDSATRAECVLVADIRAQQGFVDEAATWRKRAAGLPPSRTLPEDERARLEAFLDDEYRDAMLIEGDGVPGTTKAEGDD